MSLIKFFWRDFKSDQSFNALTILCAALGIVGLLLVESFKVGIEEKVSKNAKNFIASDLSISARRAFEKKEMIEIEKFTAHHQFPFALWIETYSLISKHQKNSSVPLAKLADLNFVTENFPFYGGVVLEGKGQVEPKDWGALHERPKIWISRDLSWELKAKKDDQIKIGEMLFTIDGIITEDNFSSFRGFSLAPKVFLSHRYLKQTELIKFGSTATFAYIFKLNELTDIKKIQTELRAQLPDKSIKIVGPEESSQQLARSLVLLADYLGLITLLTYLLSLVGLYYFTQHFLSKKLKVYSIYKTLGMKTKTLFTMSFLHLIVLTSTAVILSTSFVFLLLPLIGHFFSSLTGEDILFRLNISSLIRILLLSLGGSVLSLGPLFWGALQTPVATIFQDLPSELKRIKFYYFLPLFIYIVLLAIFLSNSFKVGGIFLSSLIFVIFLGAIFFKGSCWILDKKVDSFSFYNRHAIKTLTRYFTSSFTIFICLLLAMTLTTFIFQLDHSLRQEFTQNNLSKRPDIFLFDLQDSQAEGFQKLVHSKSWKQTMFAPMIRGRLIKINNKEGLPKEDPSIGEFSTREDENTERLRNRGVNLSYRSDLSWSEKVVSGKFNGSKCLPESGHCEISLEESYAKRLSVKLGDQLIFDISGLEITGIVTSFRKVNWISFEPNFFILFQPGVLEEAPKTFLASFKTNSLSQKREMFSLISETFPNVSLLEVSEVVKKMTTLFDLMSLAIKLISILSLFVALIVLIAISFNHLDLRQRDMTLYQMMGLRFSSVRKIYSREFAQLISLCVLLSLLFGSALTMMTMNFIFGTEAFLRLPFICAIMLLIALSLYWVVNLRIRRLIKKKSLF